MANTTINGKPVAVDEQTLDIPLLWFLREYQGLTGTKYGCGIARCGACTIHIDGMAIRSCLTPVREAIGKQITTIEGLAEGEWGAVLKSWEEIDVPQCGFCQSGQIMSAHALLKQNNKPSKEDINVAMGGNLCRCGTYCSIRKAINRAAQLIQDGAEA